MVIRIAAQKNFLTILDNTFLAMARLLCLLLVICSVQSLQLDGASTRRPRVTKYSKTTVAPGGSTTFSLSQPQPTCRRAKMPQCAFKNCGSNHRNSKVSEGVSFFKFPSDPFRCAEWISIVAQERREDHYRPCKNSTICSIHFNKFDVSGNTQRRRLLKTAIPVLQEPATERSLMTATYRLQVSGETCILLTVDALLDISYVTKLNERADANTFVPNNAAVSGVCKEGDAETLVLTFKEFALEWSFAKTPGGERWYVDNMRLTYNSSARILEHAAKQGRRVSLRTDPSVLLFPTPVGKSFHCPEETIVELAEQDANPATIHRAKLYLRQMRLQAFMYKRDGEFGPPWHCSDSARARSETAPVAVGAALAIATAGTLVGYAIWRYLKVKKVQYDTME